MVDNRRIWRMGWDSNPRGACTPAGFQDRCLKPLGHPSKTGPELSSPTRRMSGVPTALYSSAGAGQRSYGNRSALPRVATRCLARTAALHEGEPRGDGVAEGTGRREQAPGEESAPQRGEVDALERCQ